MRSTANRALSFLGAAAIAALAGALALQYLGGLPPCTLCIYQRFPYLVVATAAGIGLWLRRPRLALGVAALALAVDAGLAAYHVGVEQGWFALPESCAASAAATTVEQLRDQLAAAPARCDQIGFTLLGLSLAAWNGIFAMLLLAVAIWTLAAGICSAAEQDRNPCPA